MGVLDRLAWRPRLKFTRQGVTGAKYLYFMNSLVHRWFNRVCYFGCSGAPVEGFAGAVDGVAAGAGVVGWFCGAGAGSGAFGAGAAS